MSCHCMHALYDILAVTVPSSYSLPSLYVIFQVYNMDGKYYPFNTLPGHPKYNPVMSKCKRGAVYED